MKHKAITRSSLTIGIEIKSLSSFVIAISERRLIPIFLRSELLTNYYHLFERMVLQHDDIDYSNVEKLFR